MALTNAQILAAYEDLNRLWPQQFTDLLAAYTKPELKTAIEDAEAWAELPATKTDFNSNLTAGNFKSNATADQKRLILIVALRAIIAS